MEISRRIASLRKDRKLSQVALAKKMRVAPSTIAGWELGHHSVRHDRLKRLARALGTTVAQLVT